MKVIGLKSEEIFDKLKLEEQCVYLVNVKVHTTNVEHKSILFTGFKTGSYCVIYNRTYDYPIDMNKVYSISVIKKLI